jgi:mono/diheme cytochrome c family protein
MFKPYLLCSAAMLLGFTAASAPGQATQAALPTQTPAAAPVPAGAAMFKNPVKPTAESQAKAKSLYAIDCAMCHGDNGSGQTDLVKSMELKLGDWSDASTLASKQDNELFSAIRNGKNKMPSEAEGRANDNEIWNLILYIRGFSKTQASK